METTSVDMLKKLPDMPDLLTLADEIAKAVVRKLTLERDIKAKEAAIVKEAMSNPAYQVGGKPPSMSFIESTYIYTGFDNSLLVPRTELIAATAELERLRSRLDLFKEFLNMWRSLSAAERSVNA